jgi:hypothetical protein
MGNETWIVIDNTPFPTGNIPSKNKFLLYDYLYRLFSFASELDQGKLIFDFYDILHCHFFTHTSSSIPCHHDSRGVTEVLEVIKTIKKGSY